VRYASFNITTAVLIGLTVWLVVGRFKARADSNWPLFYYIGLVFYHQAYPGRLNPYVILTGVIAALFIRFEFMGGWIGYLLRGIELGVLAYILFILANLVAT
jgi:hypothetical protein